MFYLLYISLPRGRSPTAQKKGNADWLVGATEAFVETSQAIPHPSGVNRQPRRNKKKGNADWLIGAQQLIVGPSQVIPHPRAHQAERKARDTNQKCKMVR